MSYAITIHKTADGVEVATASGLEHVPDGQITVGGHVPAPGMSQVATLSVTLSGPADAKGLRQFIASTATSYVGAPADEATQPDQG